MSQICSYEAILGIPRFIYSNKVISRNDDNISAQSILGNFGKKNIPFEIELKFTNQEMVFLFVIDWLDFLQLSMQNWLRNEMGDDIYLDLIEWPMHAKPVDHHSHIITFDVACNCLLRVRIHTSHEALSVAQGFMAGVPLFTSTYVLS